MRTLLLATLVLLGCATTTSSTPAAPAKEFVAEGEIRFAQSGESLSASFSSDRVVSPRVDVSKTSEGWRGKMGESVIDVNVYANRVAGSGLVLNREQSGAKEVFTAQVDGKIFRFELDEQTIKVRAPGFSSTLTNNGDGTYGPGGIIKLTGAAKAPYPWPQFHFAMVACFIGSTSAQGHGAN